MGELVHEGRNGIAAPPTIRIPTIPHFYLTPKQDDFNKIPELQVCIAEAWYDVDSIVADPEAYTKDELAALRSQVLSNLEQAWEITGGSEDQLI